MSSYNYGQMLAGAPHIHGANSVQRIMLDVLLALLPGVLVWLLLHGVTGILLILAAVIAALLTEMTCLYLRGLKITTVTDCSAAVTAILLTLSINPAAPAWVVMAAVVFAIAIGKHAFGGLGRNIFNPAMLGFAFAILSFPQHMSRWPVAAEADAVSTATPLGSFIDGLNQMRMVDEIFSGIATAGNINMYQWLAAAWLAGGIYLVIRKVIDWKVPVCMILSMFILATIFWMYDENRYLGPWWHCVLGGTMIGAFFVITDPVSSPVVLRARMLFACGVAVLTWWIRHFGALVDGVAFAVLIMNALAPLLDRILAPKVMGSGSK